MNINPSVQTKCNDGHEQETVVEKHILQETMCRTDGGLGNKGLIRRKLVLPRRRDIYKLSRVRNIKNYDNVQRCLYLLCKRVEVLLFGATHSFGYCEQNDDS